jgi:hypothetical protein
MLKRSDGSIYRAVRVNCPHPANFRKTELAVGHGFHEGRVADLDGDGDMDVLNKPYTWTRRESMYGCKLTTKRDKNRHNNHKSTICDFCVFFVILWLLISAKDQRKNHYDNHDSQHGEHDLDPALRIISGDGAGKAINDNLKLSRAVAVAE